MLSRAPWLLSASAGVGATPTDGRGGTAGTRSDPGIHRSTLRIDGQDREFSVYVPESAASGERPVVIYLHGHGDNMRHILGKGLISSASSIWMKVAEEEDFLVVYPLGLKGKGWRGKTGWNDCRSDAQGNPESDDVEFIRQLIDHSVRSYGGDRRRVYVTGMSNGGHMAMRAAMELSSEIAAVAPVVSLMPRASDCSPPTQPVPILMMHGTADPIAPFEGGAMAGGRGEVLSAQATLDTWVRWNGLEDVPERHQALPDLCPTDDSTIFARIRETQSGGNAVIGYEMRGAGHTEPSKEAKLNRLLKRVQGPQNQDIEMATHLWSFFESRSR